MESYWLWKKIREYYWKLGNHCFKLYLTQYLFLKKCYHILSKWLINKCRSIQRTFKLHIIYKTCIIMRQFKNPKYHIFYCLELSSYYFDQDAVRSNIGVRVDRMSRSWWLKRPLQFVIPINILLMLKRLSRYYYSSILSYEFQDSNFY